MWILEEYLDAQKRSPFASWFNSLPATEAARVAHVLARMEAGNFGDTKSVGEGVQERRIHTGPGYRVYFAHASGRVVLLLGGGSKRRQRWDITQAKARWRDYIQRSSGE
ncbi:type II toxin-antitoxin system RelE/ParE family toxin [Alcanivorax sp. JB21]|uniref:type II toxin-antitoxin system RelE/ParE family toxin n=1 Tax=Alcanivorax limicola TaxID=2874102 RepID=UPI001CBC39C0|nr:type II toxin-antitoxin system RelE/ParE family toxin [Alcanivorax limicola]MBZ2188131.1 type II toxin-antitoxin system RelE/ParE family toxin [Alcanivorax limicola]